MEELDRWAGASPVLLTTEALGIRFWSLDEEFLCALDELASVHTVKVVYHLRPEHTSLEAA